MRWRGCGRKGRGRKKTNTMPYIVNCCNSCLQARLGLRDLQKCVDILSYIYCKQLRSKSSANWLKGKYNWTGERKSGNAGDDEKGGKIMKKFFLDITCVIYDWQTCISVKAKWRFTRVNLNIIIGKLAIKDGLRVVIALIIWFSLTCSSVSISPSSLLLLPVYPEQIILCLCDIQRHAQTANYC